MKTRQRLFALMRRHQELSDVMGLLQQVADNKVVPAKLCNQARDEAMRLFNLREKVELELQEMVPE